VATYKDIQDYIKQRYGYSCKSCWIAHMKEVCGLNPRESHNRYDSNARTNPCPKDNQKHLIEAFKHFGMIPGDSKIPGVSGSAQGCATTVLVVLISISLIVALFLSYMF